MSFSAWAQDLPNPLSSYVNDFAEVLRPETTAELTAMLEQTKAADGREITVVTIEGQSLYGDYRDLAAFGTDLFNAWGVGNAETNTGIMLLFAMEDRQMRIVLGDGFEARYDGVAARIIDSIIRPQFRAGKVQSGVLDGTVAAIERLDLRRPPPPEPGWWERLLNWVTDLAPLLFFGAVTAAFTSSKWLPGAARLIRRFAPIKCPECNGKMLQLGDVQERQYLSDGQLLEEKLKSANYDVWLCPRDEHVTIKSEYRLTNRHRSCPDCGYHTCEVHRHTRRVPTRNTPGEAEQAYSCSNCGYTHFSVFDVPYIAGKDRDGHSGVFGSGGSGGGSSGGFGGGSSSGGGASGSW